MRVRDYEGRARAIELTLAAAEAAGLRGGLRARVGQVCEELLMNGLYNAPVDVEGRPP